MSSPAERYARARAARGGQHPLLAQMRATCDFALDPFQERACAALEDGKGVLVAAPTGAGKTVVGEFAVFLALARNGKAFYTTPIKALSNQKYAELVARYGSERVGLLTGDSSINAEAPVVVMTTEVLRNMMYVGSHTLRGLTHVVMDEVHYLADRARGAVWEEVIIHLPSEVALVSLSATVSNAEEFGEWLATVRGATEIVVEEHRPVPLWQHMLVGATMYDLFVDPQHKGADSSRPDGGLGQVNPELIAAVRQERAVTDRRGRLADAGAPRGRRGRQVRRRGGSAPMPEPMSNPWGRPARVGRLSRAQVIRDLDRAGLLPAITFIFSRVGCDAAVTQLLGNGIRLTTSAEADQIRTIVETRVAALNADDLGVLRFWEFLDAAMRGFAAHHAGMLPIFREIVEELFVRGYIRAVFATETLALGVNMPARTVVLEKLVKFNGDSHVDITPAEYTQLTGRAGRRGIDVEGHAVVLWNSHVDPVAVGGLASTRTYPLRSSFRPTYNMAVNLVGQFGRDRARSILETSFAQFQADRAVVGLTKQLCEHEEALAGYAEAMTCHLGDFAQYGAWRHELGRLERDEARARTGRQRQAAAQSLAALRPGDVVYVPVGRRRERCVVVPVGPSSTVMIVTEDARLRALEPEAVPDGVSAIAHVRTSAKVNYRNPKARRDLASTVRAQVPHEPPAHHDEHEASTHATTASEVDAQISALRRKIRSHPCHSCPDREHHARWAERWWRLERETRRLRARVRGRTNSIARTFDRTCALLDELGYLEQDGTRVTADGHRLARIYSERDLLTAQCLRAGVWDGLEPAELASAVSCLVNEPRRDEREVTVRAGGHLLAASHEEMVRLWSELDDVEEAHHLTSTPFPDAGIAHLVHAWARGRPLDAVLAESELAAGDFVRRCKQLVDLLDQIAAVAPTPELSSTARQAVNAVVRGVVAADRLD